MFGFRVLAIAWSFGSEFSFCVLARISGFNFRVSGLRVYGFALQGSGLKVQGSGFRV